MTNPTESTPKSVPDGGRRIRRLVLVNRLLGGFLVATVCLATIAWTAAGSTAGEDLQRDIEMTEEVAFGMGAAVAAADSRAVAPFFSEEALFEDPAADMVVTGRSAIQIMFSKFLSSDSPIRNTNIFVGPGFTVTEFVWTQLCSFVACSPEMYWESVDIRGIVLQVVEDGEIVRETDYIAYPKNLLLP